MTVLIDGYNLMHAIGLTTKAMTGTAFERSRERLLDWLAEAMAGRSESASVIFDAPRARRASPPFAHRGIAVAFTRGQSADDRIAELVAAAARPETLTVVSNDRPVCEGARRRGCRVFACSEFVDWLLADRSAHTPRSESEKPAAAATPDELAEWLEAFSAPKPRAKR